MIYWYLQGISDLRLQVHQVTQRATEVQAAAVAAAAAAKRAEKAGTNKKKKGGDKEKLKPSAVLSRGVRLEVFAAAATRDMCTGLMMLIQILKRLDFTPPTDLQFTPLHRRFEQRFAVFSLLVRPPAFTLDQYVARCNTDMGALPLTKLVDAAISTFKSAKGAIDRALHIPDLLATQSDKVDMLALARVAVANGVLLASTLQQPPPPGTRRATFDFKTHPCFPVVKLTESPVGS